VVSTIGWSTIFNVQTGGKMTSACPKKMGKMLLLMETELAPEQMAGGLRIMARSQLRRTGQNLIWLAENTITRSVLAGDTMAVAAEIRVTEDEGIQADFSFHQHGAIIYAGGYGRGFSLDGSQLALLAHETRFAFPQEKMDVLADYILDGQQWMIWGDTFDYSVTGREISRRGISARSLIAACERMQQLPSGRDVEFAAFARHIQGEDAPGLSAGGNRYFWHSDFMVHRRPDWYASVKTASDRTLATETGNNENLQGYHLGQGVTLFMRRGEEYEGLFPLWDWHKLPGITAATA
jgi:chondroitin AC lyase